MGIRARLGLTRDDGLQDIAGPVAANTAVGFGNQPSAPERELDKELGIDKLSLEDDGINKILETLAFEPIMQAVVKDGKYVLDAENKPVYVQTGTRVRPWALALRGYKSQVMATRVRERYDVETAKLKWRRDFLKLKRMMPVNERVLFSGFIDAVLEWCEGALDDSKDGQKEAYLKIQRRSLEVGVRKGGFPQPGGK